MISFEMEIEAPLSMQQIPAVNSNTVYCQQNEAKIVAIKRALCATHRNDSHKSWGRETFLLQLLSVRRMCSQTTASTPELKTQPPSRRPFSHQPPIITLIGLFLCMFLLYTLQK